MPTLIAHDVTLAQWREHFGITRITNPDFAPELLVPDKSNISGPETSFLDRVQQNYLSQFEARSLNEESVKMVLVSPLLDIAGFYRYPYIIDSKSGTTGLWTHYQWGGVPICKACGANISPV